MNRERPPSSSPEAPTQKETTEKDGAAILKKLQELTEWMAQNEQARQSTEVIERAIDLLQELKNRGPDDVKSPVVEPPPAGETPPDEQLTSPPSTGRKAPPRRKMSPTKSILLGFAGTAALMASRAKLDEMERADIAAHQATMEELEKSDAVKIRERLGFDLAEIARTFGFEAQLRVDNGTGKYILHIGQSHTHPLARYTEGFSFDLFEPIWKNGQGKETKESQQHIVSLLTSVRATSEGTKPLEMLFCEGVDAESLKSGGDKQLENLRKYLNDIEALAVEHPQTPTTLVHCYQWVKQLWQRAKKEQSVHFAALMHYVKKILDAKTAAVLRHYKTSQKSNGMVNDIMRNSDIMNLETTPLMMNIDLLDSDQDLILEAPWQLALQGVVKRLAPAEKKETNERAINKIQEMQTIYQSMRQAESAGDAARVQELKKDFDRARDQSKNLAMEPREDIAVQCILDELSGIQGRIIPLIYGANHSFSNNIRKRALGKLGLIDLIPTSGLNVRGKELFKNRPRMQTAAPTHQRHQLQKNQPRGKGR